MKKLFTIYRVPDPEEGGGNPPDDNDAPKKRTSKDIVAGDDKRVKQLETHVSELQKLRQEDKGLIQQLQEKVEAAVKIPSQRKPGKNLLDEINDFLGFGESTPETSENPTPKV